MKSFAGGLCYSYAYECILAQMTFAGPTVRGMTGAF